MPRTAVDAAGALPFVIENKHIVTGRCGKPGECVVAQALNDALGGMLDGAEVGASIIKVYVGGPDGKCFRYATPARIARQIPVFDKTGQWDLPPGEYTLHPPSPTARLGGRPSRWNRKSKKKTKRGRDMFQGRALPTRRVMRVETLCSTR